MGQLSSPVGAEVHVDDRVAVTQGAIDTGDDRGRYELVRLASDVRRLDRRARRGRPLPDPVHDGVVATLDTIPPLVAIHRPIASPHARHPGVRMHLGQPLLERGDEPACRRRRRVSSVEQSVDADSRHVLARRELDQREQVSVVRMHTARTDQADGVQPPGRASPRRGGEQGGPREERTVGDRGIDPWQVLEHGLAGADVQVAHLGVAHLPGRQSDGVLGCPQDRVRPACQQPTPNGHPSRGDRVGRHVAPDAEPVDDDEHDGSRPRVAPPPPTPMTVTRRARVPARSAPPSPRCPPSRRA